MAAVMVIDFYLDEARKQEREQIIQLVNKTDDASNELLRGYVREAMRKSKEQSMPKM
jgi:linoleate 10R-lipoxygenase